MGSLRKAAAIGPLALLELMGLSALALRFEVALRTRPLSTVARSAGLRISSEPTTPVPWRMSDRERRRHASVNRILRHWPFGDRDGMCLRRALLLGWVLREREPVLRIGAANNDGELLMHAWLEIAGRKLGADDLSRPFPISQAGLTDTKP